MRGEKSRERKVGRLQRVPLACEHTSELVENERGDRDGRGGTCVDAVRKNVESDRFSPVEPYENWYHVITGWNWKE
jgi:hypothetical protein